MAKRFSDTEIWKEDWFLDLPNEYKLFWFYILSSCNQAGFFKVNVKSFSFMIEEKISENSALEFFNKGKKRIRKINDNLWLIEDFFKFQYGTKFNTLNKMHIGIGKIYSENGIKLETLRGVERVSIPSKRSTESV